MASRVHPGTYKTRHFNAPTCSAHLATELELSDFLKSVEKRAFKRSVYHVRNEESALDIVQDSMMKLAEHYGDKPPAELPMLFQRILSNCTLDWFRRQKTRGALFSNMSDFESAGEDGDFDLLETLNLQDSSEQTESAESTTARAQILHEIEIEVQELPARQREAFLMRYWEELDVAETAAAMGCSEGSVKTHCSRAVQALSKSIESKGNKTMNTKVLSTDYRQALAEDRFGHGIAAYLSDASDAIPHDISERLRVARSQAVSKRKLAPALRAASAVVANGSSAAMTIGGGMGDENFSWWERIASALPLIALLIGLAGINMVQNERRASEVAEVDSALLLDDLPPSAYTDPGFAQFLKANREFSK